MTSNWALGDLKLALGAHYIWNAPALGHYPTRNISRPPRIGRGGLSHILLKSDKECVPTNRCKIPSTIED
jgi:hypothetical protein